VRAKHTRSTTELREPLRLRKPRDRTQFQDGTVCDHDGQDSWFARYGHGGLVVPINPCFTEMVPWSPISRLDQPVPRFVEVGGMDRCYAVEIN
jgi:hypothetical protein